MPRKVCLSGFAAISRHWANMQPDDVEIWGMNEGHAFLRRKPNRWFQIHPKNWNRRAVEKNDWEPDNYGRHPAHVQWLSEQDCPVYMKEVDERIPTAVKFPMEKLLDKYRPYFTSTIAYMLGLLLYEHEQYRWWKPWTWKMKVEWVTLAGIEMAVGTEYMIQRPCVEYFLGKLEGKGVKFVPAPGGTSILTSPWLYAVDHDHPILEGEIVPVYASEDMKTSVLPQVKFMEEEGSNDRVVEKVL